LKEIQKAKEEAKAEAQAEMKGFVETIKQQSRREAKQEIEAEMKALRQTNKVLKEQAEKTATVVAPEDYEQTKKQVEMLEADNERLSRERKDAIKELQDTKKTLEAVQSPDANQKVVDEAKDSFDNFAIATYNYIRRYGGFVWAFDKWADVPADTKKNFEKAVQALSAFSQQMVNNVGGLE
jgi:chromosome segregation ATPase